MKTKQVDLEQYRGMVYSRAIHCYNLLPASVKGWTDVEDLVQDGMLFLDRVVHQRGGRTARYDATRSSFSTWIYSAVSNFYQGWAAAANCKKRFAIIVSLEDATSIANRASFTPKSSELIDAYQKVQQLHLHASIDLVAFLDMNLFHTPPRVARPRGPKFSVLASEFRTLASRFNVSLNEYRLMVYAYRKQGAPCRTTSKR